MKTSIIIHGHFYQPPRENPYTGIVQDQSSARPYKNWNEAIYETCYKPNTASRYLTGDGKIECMYNNYALISSNFGQTLLDWADDTHPHFINVLKKADEMSIKRFGHSCFIAQGFNHTIMPLDNESTKKVQTVWAIESYKKRFGHNPEGFWLAECAIDEKTVDILAENGIKFVILAPWQAVAIDGKNLEGKPMPSDRPFIIKGEKGSTLSAFFYDGTFASGVSFGHMLRDADAMFKRLKDYRKELKEPKLLTWATDGEIYGHHEPFGDMGLAALIRKIEESSEFEIENFASYLEKHPATEVATLNPGEDGKGSSWSCMHGVGRWMRNCGCHTGGSESWNQSWRGPLRKAFNNLEDKTREIFDAQVSKIYGSYRNYNGIILGYSSVVSHSLTVQEYVESLKKSDNTSLNYNECTIIASLLEAFKNVMFSYTSCGWFFNDISGIEPKQNMTYALYAAEILDSLDNKESKITKALLSDLSLAKSNIKEEGTGLDIIKKCMPKCPDYARACIYFEINRQDKVSTWGFYSLLDYKSGFMKIKNNKTLIIHDLEYETHVKSNGDIEFKINNISISKNIKISASSAFGNTLHEVVMQVADHLSENITENFIDAVAENIGLYLVATNKSHAKDTFYIENSGSCLLCFKALILQNLDMDFDKRLMRLNQLCNFITIKGRPMDIEYITELFSRRFIQDAIEYLYSIDETKAWQTLALLRLAREHNLRPEITSLQNTTYRYILDPTCSQISDALRLSLRQDLNFK